MDAKRLAINSCFVTYVAGNSGNQAFPEIPGIPTNAQAIPESLNCLGISGNA